MVNMKRILLIPALLIGLAHADPLEKPIRLDYEWRCEYPDGSFTNHQDKTNATFACLEHRWANDPTQDYFVQGGRHIIRGEPVSVPDPVPDPIPDPVPDPEPDPIPDPDPPPMAYTPTHYVTASASGGGAGSSSNPWTLNEAMVNARAGNVVLVGPGRYSASPGDATTPAFRPYADGTASSPIVFVAQYPAATEDTPSRWSQLIRTGGATSPVVGAGGNGAYRSHIVFDGFYLDYNDGAYPTSRGVVYVGFGNRGVQIRRFRIQRANLGSADDGDNYNCIQIHGSADTVIADNLFLGGLDLSGSHNESCITTYGAQNFTIEHNEFRGVTAGVFVKGSFSGTGNTGVVRYNRFSGFKYGVEMTESTDSGRVEIRQNLFHSWPGGYSALNYENGVGGQNRNFVVRNNTVVVPADGGDLGGVGLEPGVAMTGNEFSDNIVYAPVSTNQVLVNAWQVPNLSPFAAWDGNVYFNGGQSGQFAVGGAIVTGLPAWRTASGRDASAAFVDPALDSAYNRTTATPAGKGAYITGSEVIGIR